MKKLSLFCFLLLGGCSTGNTPDFILKHTDPVAYETKQLEKECYNNYYQNRVIQVDGVSGEYHYMANSYESEQACQSLNQSALDSYQGPQEFAIHRRDIKPLTK